MTIRLAKGMLAAAALSAVLGLGCSKRSSGSAGSSGCGKDSDCGDPAAFRCDAATGACLCRTSQGCSAGEICNDLGYCQSHVGCSDNSDCPTGFLCDSTASACIAVGRCANDLQCSLGQVCDPSTKTCLAGCKSAGDCGQRAVCLCAGGGDGGAGQVPCQCDALDAEGRVSCPVGQCSTTTCASDSDCAYGQRCRAAADGGLPACASDYDPSLRPYCDNCVWSQEQDTCGSGPNFCLYSTYTQSNYCGVDCSQGQGCAEGYECKDVIVVYRRTLCTSTDQCAGADFRSSQTCSKDSDCPLNGLCSADGFCYGRCTPHEGANQSFCACVVDDDCVQDSCEPTTRTCTISKRPCDLYGNGCAQKIRCVDFGGQGGCVIGQNCKPLEGLTCAGVRPPLGTAPSAALDRPRN